MKMGGRRKSTDSQEIQNKGPVEEVLENRSGYSWDILSFCLGHFKRSCISTLTMVVGIAQRIVVLLSPCPGFGCNKIKEGCHYGIVVG